MPLTVVTSIDVETASVRLTVSGGVPPYIADASPGGDRSDYRVRTSWSSVIGNASTRIGVDGGIPLNTPTQYVVTDATGAQATTPAVSAASDHPILSDATDPGRALSVRVASQKPNGWQAQSVWWSILGASAPFASVAPMRLRSGPMTLRVESLVERGDLRALLLPGNPLVFRGVCADAVDDLTLLVESVDESLVLDDRPAGPFLWTLNYQAISQDLGPYALDSSRSYASVVATLTTYATVLATFATYDALRVGDATSGLGPELLVNGTFSAGLTSWGQFWNQPGVVLDAAAGTGRGTMTTAGPASMVLENDGANSMTPTTPGKRYRLTGRVRSSTPGVVVYLHFSTNTAPNAAAYFSPGVSLAQHIVPASASWSTFTVEAVVPAGHDLMGCYFRADGMVSGAVVEFDDLSMRERV